MNSTAHPHPFTPALGVAEARRLAVAAIGGPLAMGVCFAFASAGVISDIDPVGVALAWPVAILGTTLLCAPTLYIAAAFAGVAPDPRTMLRALGETMAAAGRLLVGLVPATLFLAVTMGRLVDLLSLAVIALVAVVSLGGLYRRTFRDRHDDATARFLFAGWSVVYLAIGFYLFVSCIA